MPRRPRQPASSHRAPCPLLVFTGRTWRSFVVHPRSSASRMPPHTSLPTRWPFFSGRRVSRRIGLTSFIFNQPDATHSQFTRPLAHSLVSMHVSCTAISWPPFSSQLDAASRRLTSALVGSIVSTRASRVATSWPLLSNQLDAGMWPRVDVHESCQHLAASNTQHGPLGRHLSPAQEPAGALLCRRRCAGTCHCAS